MHPPAFTPKLHMINHSSLTLSLTESELTTLWVINKYFLLCTRAHDDIIVTVYYACVSFMTSTLLSLTYK